MMSSAQAAPAMFPEVGYMPMPHGFEYKEVFLHGRPRHRKYDDFWIRHPPMDITHRAKIFAPFDALAGFDDWIRSKETLYTDRRELSEGEKEALSNKIAILNSLTRNGKEARKNRPVAAVTYFVPCSDSENFAYGSQGRYETVTGMVTKVDTVITQTITVDQQVLPLDLVTDISVPSAGLPGAEHGSLAFREEI